MRPSSISSISSSRATEYFAMSSLPLTSSAGLPAVHMQRRVEVGAGAGLEVGALGVGNGQQHALADIRGKPEHFSDLTLILQMQRRPGRSESSGAKREREAPRGR